MIKKNRQGGKLLKQLWFPFRSDEGRALESLYGSQIPLSTHLINQIFKFEVPAPFFIGT